MIVVDTSVWVDFFRQRTTPQAAALTDLLEDDAGVAITDVVLTELLQGVSNAEAPRFEEAMLAFDVLRLGSIDDYTRAAALYRQARSAGQTVRRTVDCLIASVCVREGLALLHADVDFDRLARCTELETVAV